MTGNAFKASATLELAPRAQYFHATPRREEEAAKPAEAEVEEKGWWDPLYMIPIGWTFAIPALHNEFFVINEETQVCISPVGFADTKQSI